jgi:hypothetical protein
MATAEFAIVLPVIVALLVWLLGAVLVGLDQVRCVDAARLAARSLARADPESTALGLARTAAPPGSSVSVVRSATTVTVTVSSHRSIGGLGSWGATGSATAALEQAFAAGSPPEDLDDG